MEVVLTADVWERMKAYVDLCEDEISGLGKVEKDGDDFRIVDIALFKQTVSAAHSDITAQSLAEFQVELIKKGESMEDWYFWWHSHAKMGVFFSGTDTSTIDSSTELKCLVSLVTNHAHEFCARVDVYEHARLHKNLEVVVEEAQNEAVIEACRAEIAEKVTQPSRPVWTTPPANGNMGFQKRYDDENDYDGYGVGTGYQSTLLTPPTIDTVEELEEALEKVGTDDYALAFDTFMDMKESLETEIDYLSRGNDKKKVKAKRKELNELIAIGKEHGLDAYGL